LQERRLANLSRTTSLMATTYNLLVKRTCASYAGWSAHRER
jgi:hypothetical protein